MEEFKSAHNMKEKKGPGLGHMYDVRAGKRPSPTIPMAGTPLARKDTGMFPARMPPTSSRAIGAWWTDPIFSGPAVTPPEPPSPSKGIPSPAQGKTTTSDYGSYFTDPELDATDLWMAQLRAENGIKRILPVQNNSRFALEALPTEHRLL